MSTAGHAITIGTILVLAVGLGIAARTVWKQHAEADHRPDWSNDNPGGAA